MKTKILLFVCCIFLVLVCLGCESSTDIADGPVAEERVHVRAAWSPDGQTIAFLDLTAGKLGLYLVDTSGANLRLLYPGDAIGVTWSPDNEWVAFSSLGNLYKIRVNGESKTQLTTIPGSIRPAWSQDGQRIAFLSGTTFVLNLQNNLEEDMQFAGNYPSWHPNGVDLVVMEILRDAVGIGGLYRFRILNPGTRTVQTMHSFSSPEDCAFSSINAAGTEIIYGAKPLNNYTQVWKVTLETQQHISLTDDGGDYPAWSPDGNKIVYTRTLLDDGGLWIMNADGTGKRRLTTP
ncbi:MAG TPA: hypothetical protein VIL52_04940 [Bacteroidota bacterium]